MIGGSILWLFLSGLDMGTAAEQLLNGMMASQLLLAIPLFVLAAEFMNTGSIMDRLLRFCNASSGASGAGSRKSTSCRASSSRACRAPRSPTPRPPAS